MAKIIGKELANIPWQEKPQDYPRPVWRYTENPIIDRYAIPTSNSIFNSAVVPFEDGFAGVFRCDSLGVSMDIYAGFSKDAIHWEINHDPIRFEGADPEILNREYRYDPRVCFIEDRYYITWCNGYHGPTIGVAYTFDFKTFVQLENAFFTIQPQWRSTSQERLMENLQCCLVRVIQDIHHLVISSIVRARILNIGAAIVS